MSSFIIKIIALIAMTFDHTGKILLDNNLLLTTIGRIAFPLFAFQIIEGFYHTKNLKKYLLRLFLVALIAEVPFYFLFKGLDTIFTLIAGLLIIIFYRKTNDNADKFFLISIIILFGIILQLLLFDYGLFGILLIFILYLFRDSKLKRSIFFMILLLFKYLFFFYTTSNILITVLYFLGTASSLFIINNYNHKQGKNIKYLFYIYYPLHLYILLLLSFIIK